MLNRAQTARPIYHGNNEPRHQPFGQEIPLRRQATYQTPRHPRPQDFKFTINEPYDDPVAEEDPNIRNQARRIRQQQER